MISHGLTAEEGIPTENGWVMLSNCYCGLLVMARARTVRRAQRKLVRRMRDHRGSEAAAGPGGTE